MVAAGERRPHSTKRENALESKIERHVCQHSAPRGVQLLVFVNVRQLKKHGLDVGSQHGFRFCWADAAIFQVPAVADGELSGCTTVGLEAQAFVPLDHVEQL